MSSPSNSEASSSNMSGLRISTGSETGSATPSLGSPSKQLENFIKSREEYIAKFQDDQNALNAYIDQLEYSIHEQTEQIQEFHQHYSLCQKDRVDWEREKNEWQLLQNQWTQLQFQFQQEKMLWQQEKSQWQQDRAQWQQDKTQWQQDKQDWNHDKQDLSQQIKSMEREKSEWEHERELFLDKERQNKNIISVCKAELTQMSQMIAHLEQNIQFNMQQRLLELEKERQQLLEQKKNDHATIDTLNRDLSDRFKLVTALEQKQDLFQQQLTHLQTQLTLTDKEKIGLQTIVESLQKEKTNLMALTDEQKMQFNDLLQRKNHTESKKSKLEQTLADLESHQLLQHSHLQRSQQRIQELEQLIEEERRHLLVQRQRSVTQLDDLQNTVHQTVAKNQALTLQVNDLKDQQAILRSALNKYTSRIRSLQSENDSLLQQQKHQLHLQFQHDDHDDHQSKGPPSNNLSQPPDNKRFCVNSLFFWDNWQMICHSINKFLL